jgi:hypothetical protein
MYAKGTDATCTLQGWLFQFADAAAYFNFLLSLHFYGSINLHFHERWFRKVRRWVYLSIILAAIGLASGGIPFYLFGCNLCAIFPPPTSKTWLPSL